ncbi:MAG: Clp1/GlmU family protein [Candidatus Aminicenantia bacterium]
MKQFNFSSFISLENVIIPNSWIKLMKIIENWKGVFMVVGGVSSGKSTFVKYLSSSFLEKGKRVAIIDADIGQSWIGPPITISAILLPKERVNPSRPDCMAFTGMLSPAHDIRGYLINLKKVFEIVKREAP